MKIHQTQVPMGLTGTHIICDIHCANDNELQEAISFVVKLKLDALATHAASFCASEKLKSKTSTAYCFGYCDRLTRKKTMYTVTIRLPTKEKEKKDDSK